MHDSNRLACECVWFRNRFNQAHNEIEKPLVIIIDSNVASNKSKVHVLANNNAKRIACANSFLKSNVIVN